MASSTTMAAQEASRPAAAGAKSKNGKAARFFTEKKRKRNSRLLLSCPGCKRAFKYQKNLSRHRQTCQHIRFRHEPKDHSANAGQHDRQEAEEDNDNDDDQVDNDVDGLEFEAELEYHYKGEIPFLVKEFERRNETAGSQSRRGVQRAQSTLRCELDPDERTQTYVEIQKSFISTSFGGDSLIYFKNGDLEGLLKHLRREEMRNTGSRERNKSRVYSALEKFQSDTKCNGNDLLDLIRLVIDATACGFELPKAFGGISERQHRQTEKGAPKAEVIDVQYPETWGIEGQVQLIVNDPVAILAMLLVHPKTWSLWGDEIKYEALKQEGGRAVSHYMSGRMANHVAERHAMNVSDGKPGCKDSDLHMALTYYGDAACPNDFGALKKIEVAVMTCLNFSPEMQEKSFTKRALFYINHGGFTEGMNAEEIASQLMKNGAFRYKTHAERSVERFFKSLYQICHERFVRAIRYANAVGVEIFVPGRGQVIIRPYLACLNADKPALYSFLALKEGNCTRGCHLCCFNCLKSTEPYDPAIHKQRNFKLLIEQQAICSNFIQMNEEGEEDITDIRAEGSAALEFVATWGAQPFVSSLLGAPLGYDNNFDIYQAAVRDIFHDLDAGLFPSVVMMVLRIIRAIGLSDQQYTHAIALADEYTSSPRVIRHIPAYRNIDHTTFNTGIPSMLLKTTKGKDDSGAGGTTAGMRSAWSKPMADAILTALLSGDIIPDEEDYVFKRRYNANQSRAAFIKTVTIMNPTRICILALSALLDVHSEFHRKIWTPNVVSQVQNKVRALQAVIAVLYHTVVSICRNKGSEDGKAYEAALNKLHSIIHTPSRGMIFGDLSQTSTAGRESTHREYVNDAYNTTSKRRATHGIEMNNALLAGVVRDMDTFAEAMRDSARQTASNALQTQRRAGILKYADDFIRAHKDVMPSHYRCPLRPAFDAPRGTKSIQVLMCGKFIDNNITETLLIHGIAKQDYATRIGDFLDRSEIKDADASVVSALKCTGSIQSIYRNEILHCNANLQKCGPAYSFLELKDDEGSSWFGRVVAITRVVKIDGNYDFILDVALMQYSAHPRRSYIPWESCEWIQDEVDLSQVKIKSFWASNLVDHAWVVPVMRTKASVSSASVIQDKFYHKPRSFYEKTDTTCYDYICRDLEIPGESPDSARRWISDNCARGSHVVEISYSGEQDLDDTQFMIDPYSLV